MGMIIYKKQHIKLISVDPYQSTYYQSVICLFTVGYICFLYMEEDSWSLSLQVTKMMDTIRLSPVSVLIVRIPPSYGNMEIMT